MSDFSIQFTYPWLLLLIIPAVGVALFLHFRINKKFRRNRNRIISLVLHCVTCVLCITVLAGIHFDYKIPNDTNEIILLVDVSQSEEQSEQTRDEFVEDVLHMGRFDGFRMGVITFGFDQSYAVPLTDDVDDIFLRYMEAPLPQDTSGTDIAAALTYASEQFTNPVTGKIVLITDGKETDEEALSVIRSVSARGISVDTAYIASDYSGRDVSVTGVEYPDYHINPGEAFELTYTLQSSEACQAAIGIYDNGTLEGVQVVQLAAGVQSFNLDYTFDEEGLHELSFSVSAEDDVLEENNQYVSYYYLEEFNRVLIIEDTDVTGNAAQSDNFVALLEEGEYEVEVLDFADSGAAVPQEATELCRYDQVILNNVNQYDMPEGFIDILYSYVYEYGGGMLTVGGNDSQGNVHAYDQSDMYNTLLQSMLPVEIESYTPPVAVIILIDVSGSMGGDLSDGNSTMLDAAREGAYACLDALSYRDYIGIMTLSDGANVVLPLTSRTQETLIERRISEITTTSGGTVYTDPIRLACQTLGMQTDVAKRHLIIISDGEVGADQSEEYLAELSNAHDSYGLTASFVGIGMAENSSDPNYQVAEAICEATGDELTDEGVYSRLHCVSTAGDLANAITEDINSEEITSVNDEPFHPIRYADDERIFEGVSFIEHTEEGDDGSEVVEETDEMTAELGGFYGGRVRDEDYLIISGEYDVPIYAQWQFGAGNVGSYMSDLGAGGWSDAFLADAGARQLILNIVKNLMPARDIEPPEVDVSIQPGNFINRISVYDELEDGQIVRGTLSSTDGSIVVSLNEVLTAEDRNPAAYITTSLNADNNYSRCTLVIKQLGVYTLTFEVCSADGATVYRSYSTYHVFSYSAEYADYSEDPRALLMQLASDGGGTVVEDLSNPDSIFSDFVTAIDITYDPRLPILITAIVLFLIDIAVRKFKFKWPHEIIKERRERKLEQEQDKNK